MDAPSLNVENAVLLNARRGAPINLRSDAMRTVISVGLAVIFLAPSAAAELLYCFDDLVAYDTVSDRSWVTDYSSQTGFHLHGCLDDVTRCGPVWTVSAQLLLVDAGNFHDWRIPTLGEYLSIIPQTEDCGSTGTCMDRPWKGFGGKWWQSGDCNPAKEAGSACSPGGNFVIAVGSDAFNARGDTSTVDWYSQNNAAAVRTGNACASAPEPVPAMGPVGGLALIALVLGLGLAGIRARSVPKSL
jgi:hypothetical protein